MGDEVSRRRVAGTFLPTGSRSRNGSGVAIPGEGGKVAILVMAEITLDDLRKLLMENCMLRVPPEEIQW